MRLDHVLLPFSLLLVGISAILSQRNAMEFARANSEVERLNRVISANELLLSSLKDLETGQRGYLLTGDREYLKPYEQAERDLPERIEYLRRNIKESQQAERVRQLTRLVSQKRAEVQSTLLVRDRLGPDAALAIVKTDKGRESMEAIRTISAAISQQGHESLDGNSGLLAERQKGAAWISIGITITLAIFLALATITIQRGVWQRDRLIGELLSARQQIQTTLLSIGDGVVATDADGRVTFLNPAASRITGWREQDALGKKAETVLPFVEEETREPIEHPVVKVLREKQSSTPGRRALLLKAGGGEAPIDDGASPIFAADGATVNGAVVIFRDITARHVADRAIRKWEHVFQHAGFGMAILTLGANPLLEQVNPAFARMHGYAPEELLRAPLSTVVSSGTWEKELEGLRGAEAGGHLLLQTIHQRKDGTVFPALADVTVVRDEHGKVLYGTAYYSDITERVNAEEELRKNEARFRTLADSLPQLVWTTLPDGTPDYFNSRWADEFGSSLESTNGQGFLHFLHEEDRERCHAEWKKATEEGTVFQTECRLRSPKNSRWYICRSIPVRDADGKIVRWFGSCTDIDEQKRSADAIRASKEELERSNLDLEQFAFAASHDLQEPLRMIVIYSQLLQEEYGRILEDKGRTYLNFAVGGALRMESLLKGLLTYARAATSEVAPPEGVPVEDGLRKAIANLALQIQETGTVIRVGDLPRVDVPEVYIMQVFQNLISNAIKYRRVDLRPEVSITAARQGAECVFAIRDNGIGIDPNYHEHIFRVFGRLHGNEYPGTGIGLALCQRLIKRHGGRIWVESEPDTGSTFFFTLPARC